MREFRFAWRRLVASPGFAVTAVLSLALGIGANTAVFSALNAVLYRPLPVAEPERLVFFDRNAAFPTYSYPAYRDFRERQRSLEDVALYRFTPVSVGVGAGRENARSWAYLASGNYFSLLGVKAALGRTLTEDDDRLTGGHPVMVLSYGGWQRRFGGDPRVVGKTARVNGRPFTVVGVMPREFRGTEVFFAPDLWMPVHMQPQIEGYDGLTTRGEANYFLIGRLRTGLTKEGALQELNGIAARLTEENPQSDLQMTMTLSPPGMMGKTYRGPAGSFGLVMLAATGLVLLIACANLSGILLARAADRQRDTAIRLALGARRWQLVRTLLAEAVLLSLAGGVGALLLGMWVLDLAVALRPKMDFAIATPAGMDWRAFLFTLVVAMVASLLFGLLPARTATRVDLVPSLKADARRAAAWRRFEARDALVLIQVALSVVLVVATGWMVESLRRAQEAPLGFRPEGLYSVAMDLGLDGYPRERQREFRETLIRRARAESSLESAALAGRLPLGPERSFHVIEVEGQVLAKGEPKPTVLVYRGRANYFRTLGAELVAGRDFSEQDEQAKDRFFAAVNETFVRKYLGAGNPIGRRFQNGFNTVEILAVVRDGRYLSLGEEPRPAIFYLGAEGHLTLLARSRAGQERTLALMRKLVRDIDPAVTVFETQSMADHLNWAFYPVRASAGLLTALGALAMLLAAVGIYGVVAYSVARRTREIGVRMAIGASSGDVLRLFAGRTAVMAGGGLAFGLALALAAARYASPVLYGVNAYDPLAYVRAVAVVLAVSAVAAWRPAAQAMRLNPVTALRQE